MLHTYGLTSVCSSVFWGSGKRMSLEIRAGVLKAPEIWAFRAPGRRLSGSGASRRCPRPGAPAERGGKSLPDPRGASPRSVTLTVVRRAGRTGCLSVVVGGRYVLKPWGDPGGAVRMLMGLAGKPGRWRYGEGLGAPTEERGARPR